MILRSKCHVFNANDVTPHILRMFSHSSLRDFLHSLIGRSYG